MYVSLAPQVAALLAQVSIWRHHFEGEHGLRVWTVSSTARGGGVAEMMGRLVSGLGGFGVPARWLIMDAEAEFFTITKRLHNAIHGHVTCSGDSDGDGDSVELLSDADRALFNRVGEREADELVDNFMLPAGLDPSRDLILCHDPQTLAMMPQLRARLPGAKIAWRCHVGLDSPAPCVAAVWAVLEPLAAIADACIFSSPSYVRERLRSRSCIMRPGLSPLSPKNRECSPAEVISLLWRGGLLRHLTSPRCALYKAFEAKAVCYGADAAAASGEQVLPPAIGAVRTAAGAGEPIVTAACGCTCAGGICAAPSSTACLLRPIVLQVSRWDALKGWSSLLAAWAQIKSGAWPAPAGASAAARVRYDHYIESAVLVLAGPEPASIADDPEGREVLARLQREYDALPESVRKDVVLALLPMANAAENALIVNALQRSAAVIVQNSLEEGFGLTCVRARARVHATVAATAARLSRHSRQLAADKQRCFRARASVPRHPAYSLPLNSVPASHAAFARRLKRCSSAFASSARSRRWACASRFVTASTASSLPATLRSRPTSRAHCARRSSTRACAPSSPSTDSAACSQQATSTTTSWASTSVLQRAYSAGALRASRSRRSSSASSKLQSLSPWPAAARRLQGQRLKRTSRSRQ